LVWIALQIYVANSTPLVNALLVGVIWWSSHKLTWDSTLIDDTQDASGQGLLQVAGLDRGDGKQGQKNPSPAPPANEEAEQGKKRKREPGGVEGWIRRYLIYREQCSRRPHAPGVWVVWFSLAALPLFGIGQSLIPPGDVERRRYVFWLMTIYVGSGLGLLVTTSFLNLRRYLRQRNLQMPMAMTGVWLSVAVLMIAGLLAVGAVIPRPSAEYPLVDIAGLTGIKELKKAPSPSPDGEPEEKDRDKGAKDAGKNAQKDGQKDAQGESGGAKTDEQGLVRKQQDGQPSRPGELAEQQPSSPNLFGGLGQELLKLLKWIVFIAFGLVIAVLVLRAVLKFLANFTHWARGLLNMLQSLWDQFQGLFAERLPEAALYEPNKLVTPPPFASLYDPFLHGDDKNMRPALLVRLAFEALEAWAYERDLARQAGETPLEFAERLALDFPALDIPARQLVGLYAGVVYSPRMTPQERMGEVRKLWALLRELAEKPMSAGVR
jgi:hypothetical protein